MLADGGLPDPAGPNGQNNQAQLHRARHTRIRCIPNAMYYCPVPFY